MIKSKKQMFTVIGAFVLVMLLGTVTYAFFNYTRTGVANTIRTGRIYFNTSQNGVLNLTNVFPVASSEVENMDSVTVQIQGDTTYSDGEEFLISLVNVNNTITSGSTEKTIPISYVATYTATPVATGETANSIGTASNDYWSARESKNANIYLLNSTGLVEENKQVLVGYIKNGETGINGTLTIKAYIDSSSIAISDTYPSGDVTHTETSGETSTEVVDYTNGTTSEWVNGRTVLTTTEWNSLQTTPLSFKVKAESNEGTWVDEPLPTIPTCPGCKFMYTTESYSYGSNGTLIEDITETIYDDYNDAITDDRNIFVGITESNNRIDRAFVCYVKHNSPNEGTPFCLEGNSEGISFYNASNKNLLTSIFGTKDVLDENGCIDLYDYYHNHDYDNNFQCVDGNSSYRIELRLNNINVYSQGSAFYLCNDGTFNCN